MDLDLLERARAGDRTAFAGLIAAWDERVVRTAALLAGRDHAEPIAAAVFSDLWRALPAMHSERPFRPEMMRAVVEASAMHDGPAADEGSPVQRALATLDAGARALVVLHLFDGMATTELALVRGQNIGATGKAVRDAVGAFGDACRDAGLPTDEPSLRRALIDATAGIEPPPWFADDVVLPALREPDGPEVRRLVRAGADDAWTTLLDPTTLRGWGPEETRLRGAVVLEPGARIHNRGLIAGKRRSRDQTLVTRTGPDRVLAWTTRSKIAPWPSAIEFRWTLQIVPDGDHSEIHHRLRGVAFPAGFAGRALRAAWMRVTDAMPHAMHAGIEQLAQTIGSRARRPSL